MWLTKKKYEQLREQVRKDLKEEVKNAITWKKYEINDMIAMAETQIKWDLRDSQKEEIREEVRSFLIQLIEYPPHNFVEAIVQKINNIQLKDS